MIENAMIRVCVTNFDTCTASRNEMKNTRVRRCKHCEEPFAINRRGRPRLYCRPSHRVRAHEKRREAESKLPSEKENRLLTECLMRLARQRRRFWMVPDKFGKGGGSLHLTSAPEQRFGTRWRNLHRGLRAALSAR